MNTPKSLALSLALSAASCGGLNNAPETPELNFEDLQGIRQQVANDCNLSLSPVYDGMSYKMPIERPARATHWTITSSLTPEMLRKIVGGEKLFLILGNKSCPSCENVENWWSVRSAGDFQTYHVKFPDEQGENSDYNFEGLLYGHFEEEDSGPFANTFPVCLLIERSYKIKQSYRHETVIKSVWGQGGCTGGNDESIAAWMNKRCIQ